MSKKSSLDALLGAIVADERAEVRALLKADRGLATQKVEKPMLYQEGIFHWLYARDTALHLAAAGHRSEIVKLLLDGGADTNAAANMRRSGPLHYAADGFSREATYDPKRQVATIGVLVEAGADIGAQDKNGATPLHRAVRTRAAAAVKCLLDAGADPTAKNLPGSTAFHLAVQNTGRGESGEPAAIAGQRAIIEEFLKRGVSTSLKDGSGKTVASWAKAEWIKELLTGKTGK